MVSVKILVCYHKKDVLFQDEILTPIHVGRAAAKQRTDNPDTAWLLESMIGDDTGENISLKNASYNELTAVYWAWKNYAALGNPEYIGLAHYRRHFVLKRTDLPEIVYRGEDPEEFLSMIGYSPKKLRRMLAGKDFAAHMSRVDSVYEQYIRSHRPEDLEMAVRILTELYPEYGDTAQEYLTGTRGFFCNMFLMRRELFFDYCSFLFPILEEFGKRTERKNQRLFISERLTGIYLTHLLRQKKRCRTLPVGIFAERVRIPVVIPFREERLFPAAVLLTSLLSRAHPLTRYEIFLICTHPVTEQGRKVFEMVGRKWENCRMEWIYSDHDGDDGKGEILEEDSCIFELGDLLPGLSKCLYLRETVTVLSDLEAFWRACSVDDYEIAGIPAGDYDLTAPRRRVRADLLLVRPDCLRKRGIRKKAFIMGKKGLSAEWILAELLDGQIAYLPPWTTATESRRPWDAEGIPLRERLSGRAFLLWDREVPWKNPFVSGGGLWWGTASAVPDSIILPDSCIPEQCGNQETAAAAEKSGTGQERSGNPSGDVRKQSGTLSGRDAWRSYSLLGKLRFFYHHNGLKNTLRYGIRKLSRGIRARAAGRRRGL